MANRMGPNDWRSAAPVDDDGHAAWVQNVNISSSTGATVTNRSVANMTGASQSILTAGQGSAMIFMQAPAANSGTIWINLSGGTAVVGTGLPLAPGASITIQPGIANAVTGIAATALDDLTVYAG